MDMLNCQDQSFFDEMSTYIEDDLLKLPLFYQVQLLTVYSQRGIQNPLFLCKVINAVNRNNQDISLGQYSQLWSLIANIWQKFPSKEQKKDGQPDSPVNVSLQLLVSSLMKLIPSSKYIKPSRLNLDELNKIILALASIRVKEFHFVENFLKAGTNILKAGGQKFKPEDVINFTKASYGYSNSLENYFQIAHKYCEANYAQFTPEEIMTLKKIFSLRQDILSQSSPFFKY